jgi:excisionase family DNA binding protein
MNRIKMLSRAATAKELGICARTVDSMIRRGEIKAVRIGRRVLIPEEALGQALSKFNWEICE